MAMLRVLVEKKRLDVNLLGTLRDADCACCNGGQLEYGSVFGSQWARTRGSTIVGGSSTDALHLAKEPRTRARGAGLETVN